MLIRKTSDLRVKEKEDIIAPIALMELYPLDLSSANFIIESRKTVQRIIRGEDARLMVVVGPCSIHKPSEALEYASWLADFQKKVSEKLFLVMRVYFEKPRTTIGWKGLINDPDMNGSHNINKGIRMARKLFCEITKMRVPIASEMLDPITPQFLADHISWGAIGARTTESQTHRELASGLSFPIGFKNGTDGGLQVAIDAMKAAMGEHSFLGMGDYGMTKIIRTTGNKDVHLVLRGGNLLPNYNYSSIQKAKNHLLREGFVPSIMIDCSHANSNKNHRLQKTVLDDVISQIAQGEKSIRSLMIESNINEGKQKMTKDGRNLLYGVSVTDACVSISETETMLLEACEDLSQINNKYIPEREYYQPSWVNM